MAFTASTQYSAYINALLKTSGRNARWLSRMNDVSAWVPDAPQAGVISVPQAEAFTAGDPVDGTMLTNGFSNSQAALTGYDKACTISVNSAQVKSFDFRPENMQIIAEQAADALRGALAAQAIANLVAATPGQTEALADGKIDFAAATVTELATIDRAIGYILSNSAANIEDLTILVTPTAWANIFTYRNNTSIGGSFALAGNTDFFTYNNIPIYPVSATTTSWGSGGNACLYVLHKNAWSFAFSGAYPHDPDRFWIPGTDGFYKHIVNGSYHCAVSEANLIAEVTSGSS